jgi:MraZ protein
LGRYRLLWDNMGKIIMARFRGRFDYCLDEKGRINIPAKFRKALNPSADETFVICRSPGGCLRAYAQDAWNIYEDELANRPQTPETLEHRRLLYNSISDSTLDAQGRIMLTPQQIKLIGLSKNVTLVGQNEYLEIWDTAAFDQRYSKGADDDFDRVFFQSVKSTFNNGNTVP